METLTKVKIQTVVLQDLVSRAVKGSSAKPQLPLTCLMHIEIKNKKLSITTTDDVNIMTVFTDVDAEDFDVVVDSKWFYSLVSKITTEYISLSINDKTLIIEGNGKYEKPLIMESDGTPINFPFIEDIDITNSNHITRENIRSILTMSKSCKSDQMIVPALFNYYVDDKRVITTDTYKACDNPIKMVNEPTAITPSMMDLVSLVCEEDGVNVAMNTDSIMFYSSRGKLISSRVNEDDVKSFPVNELLGVFEENLPSTCRINRTLLLNAIDRLFLFTDAYDSYKLTLTFNNKELKVQAKKANSWETINYLNELDSSVGEFVTDVDATFLRTELTSCNSEDIKIKFGGENGLQIQCDEVKLLLSVLGDED